VIIKGQEIAACIYQPGFLIASLNTSRLLIAVDKIRFRIDIARMFGRAIALVLVLSWFVLASVDVLEDVALYRQVELNSQLGTGGLTNDTVESADTSCACATWLSDQAPLQLLAFTWASPPRTSKLHKLHHSYQI
jgi:hypothetical protein